MLGFALWVLIHIVPAMAIYSLLAAFLYRPVYKHFYEKARLKTVVQRDRYGDIVRDRNNNNVRVYIDHDKAHESALLPAALSAAAWPITMWPLVVFKTATPITPARKQELADIAEEQKMERDLKRKATLAKMEKELGIDSSTKMIEGSVIKDKQY